MNNLLSFATKNSLPWLTNETKLLVRDLEQSFGSKDATAGVTVYQLRTQFPCHYWIRSLAFKKDDNTQKYLHAEITFFIPLTYYFESYEQTRKQIAKCIACPGNSPLFRPCWANELFRYNPVYIAEMIVRWIGRWSEVLALL